MTRPIVSITITILSIMTTVKFRMATFMLTDLLGNYELGKKRT